MADVAQVVAPDAMQSPRQPTPGPILQQQNQVDRALERLQDRAEEQEDSTEHPGLGSARSQADAPILLSLSLHCWRFRILDLHRGERPER
jgi:hypothetical protein